ncbi:MAG: OsmC family protein [Halobacteriales archaeon]
MSDIEIRSSNENGFSATSTIGDFELSTHAQGETAPSPNEVVVADYAQCFTYAFRATAARGDFDAPGSITTDAEADLDGEDDLTAIRLTLHVETGYSEAEVKELVAGAEDICHVHAALKPALHADVTVDAGAR